MSENWKERERIYACWLCNFPGIGSRQLGRLVEFCGGFEAVYFASREKWAMVLQEKQVEELAKYTARWRPEEQYRNMKKEQIRLVTISEAEYPERLKKIPDPPYALFFRGKLPVGTAPAVAVIGARECSEYGKSIARQLGETLGKNGVTVVSGMARGIDGISQLAALEAGGCSVGVLGSGVDICYPAQNKTLYARLQEKGAVLSSYPIGTPARPQNFPPRNRIVSGLADAVVVIEARVKSGTLITVDMALEQGREVYVVPGRVTDRLSDGCNRLIKQGAGMLLDPKEFLEELWDLQEQKKPQNPKTPGGFRHLHEGVVEEGQIEASPLEKEKKDEAQDALSPERAAVYAVLDLYPKSSEEIRERLGHDFTERQLSSCLMALCMEGLAIQVSPGHFGLKG